MDVSHRSGRLALPSLTLCVTLAAIGCASPGPPKPPSLNLPELTRDLSAERIGDTVVLRFTVPSRSTDKLPLRGAVLTARFCRALGSQPCQPVPSPQVVPLDPSASATERHTTFTWTDTLSGDLVHGVPRELRYSVELLNASGRSAGMSAPAFTAAGAAPAPVTGLRAEGSRLGVLLHWDDSPPSPGNILLQRQELAPTTPSGKASATIAQLMAPPPPGSGPPPPSLLDTTAKPGTPYTYVASRRLTVELGNRSIELCSTPSPTIDFRLGTIYPPSTPDGLTAAAFTSATASNAYAVDLVWQPVDAAGLITPLAGYNLYRAPADASAQPTRLNATPLTLPAFHDTTASPNLRYRYTVTAVDAKGNESSPTSVLLEPFLSQP